MEWARGIPQTNAGDLKMVTAWKNLGFVIANPNTGKPGDVGAFYEIEGQP